MTNSLPSEKRKFMFTLSNLTHLPCTSLVLPLLFRHQWAQRSTTQGGQRPLLTVLGVRSPGTAQQGSLLRGSPGYNAAASWAAFLSENRTGEKLTSMLIQAVNRMHVNPLSLRVLASCWLSTRGCPPSLKATPHSSLRWGGGGALI